MSALELLDNFTVEQTLAIKIICLDVLVESMKDADNMGELGDKFREIVRSL